MVIELIVLLFVLCKTAKTPVTEFDVPLPFAPLIVRLPKSVALPVVAIVK